MGSKPRLAVDPAAIAAIAASLAVRLATLLFRDCFSLVYFLAN